MGVSEPDEMHPMRTLTVTPSAPNYQPSDVITASTAWSTACLSPLIWFHDCLLQPSNQTRCSTLTERLDPGVTFVQDLPQNGNNLSNIFLFQKEWNLNRWSLSSHISPPAGGVRKLSRLTMMMMMKSVYRQCLCNRQTDHLHNVKKQFNDIKNTN